jgi:prepilin-type N-terminal cleavage/methylation domain-containing protein/prepilin-type processing-associated H-X9-DG protein
MQHKVKPKDGFTLAEILIVIAILGVLAALSFGVAGRVREKGRQATCQSNLKQIYVASQQYVLDSDSTHASSASWSEALGAYLPQKDIFACPSLPHPPVVIGGAPTNGEYAYYIGFLMTLQHENNRPKLAGVNEAQLVDTSRIFMACDVPVQGFHRTVDMPRSDACGITMGNGQPDKTQYVSTIHNGGSNLLLADGHVKWVTPENFVQRLCEAAPYLQPPFRAEGPHLP